MTRKLLMAAAAASLVAAPVAVEAAKLPVERTSAELVERSELAGVSTTTALLIAATAAAGIAVLVLSDGNDAEPASA